MTDTDFQSESEGEFIAEVEPEISLTKEEAGACFNCIGPTFRTTDKGVSYCSCTYAYVSMQLLERNLTNVSVVTSFQNVMFLDLTSNRLTNDSINALADMDKLLLLFIDNNRLESAKIPTFPYLQILSIKHNRITTNQVNIQPNLENLDLTGNNIQELRPGFWGSKKLPKLKELVLRDNGLVSSAGLNFPNLVALFLADNDITVLKGLEELKSLKFLHLRNNPLQSLDGFSKANRKLFYLNIRSCKIKNAKELKKLSVLTRLQRIVLVDNPFAKTEYRIKAIAMLPQLLRIDKTLVEKNERKKAKKLAKRMSENDEEDVEEEGADE